jgi:integrase
MRAGFATKGEAEAAKAKLQQDKAEGNHVERSLLTVDQFLQDWIKDLELEDVRPNTLDEWSSHVRNHLRPKLGKILAQQLTSEHVRDFYRELRVSGNQRTGEGLSPKSVWNIHLCLSRAMKDAIKARLRPDNPARGVIKPPKDRPVVGFWTSLEFAAFIKWIDQQGGLHDQALYRLAVQTGMRRGELLGLRWSNVDWEARHVTIVEQLARRTRGVGHFGPPKTPASRRTIVLSEESIAALGAWRETQDEQRRAWAELYEDDGLVFCHENGTSHDPRWITNRFRKQVASAGVKRIRIHDLRHSSAVIGLRELGEAIDEVSKRLGHESTAFTLDIYGHLLPQRGRDVATAFDRLVRDRSTTKDQERTTKSRLTVLAGV